MRVIRTRSYLFIRPQLLVAMVAILVMGWGVAYTKHMTAFAQSAQTDSSAMPITISAFEPQSPLQAEYKDIDCTVISCVGLTLDDGPDPTFTPAVLDELAKAHVRASFFMVGYRVAVYPDIVRRAYHAGHDVENHSWNHPDLTKLNLQQVSEQIALTQNAIVAAGVPAPTMFRPPYGARNDAVKSRIAMPIVMWSVDPEDWKATDPAKVAAAVADHAVAGSIVVMHSTHAVDVQSIPLVIAKLQAKGLTIVPVSDLLKLPPGSTGGEYFHL